MKDDLIRKQDAIEAVMEMKTENRVSWLDCVVDTLDALPSAENGWIPVSERLPIDETKVLVTVFFHGVKDYSGGWNAHIKPSFYVDIAERYDDEWHSDSDEYKIVRNKHEVIAWMPLPEPWKGEDDAGVH